MCKVPVQPPVQFPVYIPGGNGRPEMRKVSAGFIQSFTIEPCASGLRATIRSEEFGGVDCFAFFANADEAHTFSRYAVDAIAARAARVA